MNNSMLIFKLRPARCKARAVATMEALSLLRDLHVVAPAGGPLSEQGGVFWITAPVAALETINARLPRLGYTYAVLDAPINRKGLDVAVLAWQKEA